MQIDKIKAYIGFAIKSRKAIFGYDQLFECKKIPYVTLISRSLNEKMIFKINNFCNEKHIRCIDFLSLSDLCGKENCKVISIIDENLAEAIINELEMKNG